MKEILKLQGLVAYWPMNEAEGSVARNYARGTIGQHNPTITGASLAQTCKVGRAFSFDGNDSLDFLSTFDPSYATMTFGGIIVVNSANQGVTRTLFAKRTSFAVNQMRWQASINSSNNFFLGRAGSSYAFATYGNSYPKDTPFFFVLEKEAAATKLSINGVLVQTGSVVTDTGLATAVTRIAASDPTPGEFFYGKMQHFFIVNNNIGAAKILKLAQVSGFA